MKIFLRYQTCEVVKRYCQRLLCVVMMTIELFLENPVVCQEVRTPGANIPLGYKFEPWMKLTDEEVFIVDMNKLLQCLR